jgi:KUP system potassium uptake protein
MTITTLLFYRVARDRFGWSTAKALAILAPLLLIDVMFFAANVPKIPHGGWFPLVVAFVLVLQMTTWRRGRELVAARIRRAEVTLDELVETIEQRDVPRVHGTAVYLFKDAGAAPPALLVNLKHQKVLHERIVTVALRVSTDAYVVGDERVSVTDVGGGVHQVVICDGFMEDPDVVGALAGLRLPGGPFDPLEATFFLGDEVVVATELEGMHPWREQLFEVLDRGAESAARFFKLPSDRVVTIGTHVEI